MTKRKLCNIILWNAFTGKSNDTIINRKSTFNETQNNLPRQIITQEGF